VRAGPKAAIDSRSDERRGDTSTRTQICARPRGSLPRSARLPGATDFDRCLRQAPLFRQGAFALYLALVATPPEVGAAWRLGLVIPKRYEASAVARNTIKRRWREVFRAHRDAWASEFGSGDLVVRLQGPLVPRASKARGVAVVTVPAVLRGRDTFQPDALLAAAFARLRTRTGRAPGA
jgi:ribonuclease P protein component